MCRSCLIESEHQFLRLSDVKNGAYGVTNPSSGPPRGWESSKKLPRVAGGYLVCSLQSDIANGTPKANDSITCWKTHQDFLSQCSCASVMHKTRSRNTLLSDIEYESHLNEGIGRVRLWVRLWSLRDEKSVGWWGDCYVRLCITTWLSRT
jgi:hypothetical protein